MQVELAQDQRTRTRVIHQAAQCHRDPPRRLDALFDLMASLARGIFQLQFEVRKNSEQGIIDFMCGSKRELSQRRVLLVFGKFGLELALFLVELAILGEAQEKLLQSRVALLLP